MQLANFAHHMVEGQLERALLLLLAFNNAKRPERVNMLNTQQILRHAAQARCKRQETPSATGCAASHTLLLN